MRRPRPLAAFCRPPRLASPGLRGAAQSPVGRPQARGRSRLTLRPARWHRITEVKPWTGASGRTTRRLPCLEGSAVTGNGSRQGGPEPAWRQTDRALCARIAASERWARTSDRVAATAPARQGLTAKFEREVDPDGALPIAERKRRADALMRAHMLRLARASAAARRRSR